MSGARRERILAATCTLVAEQGLQKLRVAEVAARAEVSTQLLAYHFPSKRALLIGALEYAAKRAPSTSLLRERAGEAAIDTVRAALRAEFDDRAVVRELNLVWNEAAALPDDDGAVHAALAAATVDWNDQVTIGVLRCIAEGSLRADAAPQEIAAVLTAAVEGLSQRWLAGLLDVGQAQAAIDHLLDRFADRARST